jgi:hypothetical protein
MGEWRRGVEAGLCLSSWNVLLIGFALTRSALLLARGGGGLPVTLRRSSPLIVTCLSPHRELASK